MHSFLIFVLLVTLVLRGPLASPVPQSNAPATDHDRPSNEYESKCWRKTPLTACKAAFNLKAKADSLSFPTNRRVREAVTLAYRSCVWGAWMYQDLSRMYEVDVTGDIAMTYTLFFVKNEGVRDQKYYDYTPPFEPERTEHNIRQGRFLMESILAKYPGLTHEEAATLAQQYCAQKTVDLVLDVRDFSFDKRPKEVWGLDRPQVLPAPVSLT
jgi:hypothetical protein